MYVGCFKDSSDRVLESEKLFPLPNERLKCWRECICIFFTLCFYRQFLLDLNAFRKSYKKKHITQDLLIMSVMTLRW